MPLIWKGLFGYITRCSICGKRLKTPYFSTFDFLPDDHQLWPWHDSSMHWKCYASWKHRKEFASLYFESIVKLTINNPNWRILFQNDKVHFQVLLQDGDIKEYRVTLKSTGSCFQIDSSYWQKWLKNKWKRSCSHKIVYDELMLVLPTLNEITLKDFD